MKSLPFTIDPAYKPYSLRDIANQNKKPEPRNYDAAKLVFALVASFTAAYTLCSLFM